MRWPLIIALAGRDGTKKVPRHFWARDFMLWPKAQGFFFSFANGSG